MHQVGSILDGKYEIIQPLGQGGMGEVHLVRHLHLEELRVVKILRQDVHSNETAPKRFLREARLATQIKHPNVAILYDFAQLPQGSFYMVWEHIEGEDMGTWIKQSGPIPLLEAIQLAVQGLRGLEAIHAAGIIHRDLSPDNLMISKDRRGEHLVKIIDLGLAKNLVSEPDFELTQAGMFMGKLRYCSPEQAETDTSESLDPRSDLYSFALVFYEMVSGSSPFANLSPHSALVKRLQEDPAPLSSHPSIEVPEELDQVLARALARRREDRYADAVSLIDALEHVAYSIRQTQEPATAPPEAVPAATPSEPSSAVEAMAPPEEVTVEHIEGLLRKGHLEEARATVEHLEADAETLESLRQRIDAAEAAGSRMRRIEEIEQMLRSYIKKSQLPMAELALESLLEFHPYHPKREEYESWVALLRQEVEQDQAAANTAASLRENLIQGDLAAARRLHAEIKRLGRHEELATTLAAEIEDAESQQSTDAEIQDQRDRFETLLATGDLEGAERAIERLQRNPATTRVTLDVCRSRLEEARHEAQEAELTRDLDERYQGCLKAEDWLGARDIALELEKTLPDSPRPARMFAEVEKLQEAQRRRQSITQGSQQLESFLEAGEIDKAELALKILLQLDPENRKRKSYERQIRALKKQS